MWGSRFRICMAVVAVLCAVIACGGAYLFLAPAPRVPAFDQVRATYRQSEGVLLDRHGAVIHVLRVDYGGRRLDWAPLADISPSLVAAVTASEDRRFFRHKGVDFRALASAAVRNLCLGEKRGASTISMQLAGMLDKRFGASGTRTARQKWAQLRWALALEKGWSKQQVIEAYLNLVSFRGELRGIAAAAQGLFQKEPSGLDQAESLLLAALIRSPNAPPKDVVRRVAALGRVAGTAASAERSAFLAREVLTRPYSLRQPKALAPHVAHELLARGAVIVRSSLDADLQRFAAETLRSTLVGLEDENVRDGAVIVVDNRTGEVLAYVGNKGNAGTLYVDGVRARRQAGSTLKPFLYALAFDRRLIDDTSLLEDSSLHVATARGIYTPENYDRSHRGLVPVRVALASSLNVPAVRVLMLVGVEPFTETLAALGFGPLQEGDYYGYALALGSLDVTLWDLANAYRTLARGGMRGELTLVPANGLSRGERVFSPGAAALVADILSDREARSVTFGFENPLATRFWTATKTGTSKDMRDNWCLGFSNHYTVGVWVGNFSGQPMRNVSGVTGAAPVWLEIMNYLHRRLPSEAPPGVRIARATSAERSRSGKAEPRPYPSMDLSPADDLLHARIAYPPEGTFIAIDPDIPAGHQRVFFEASPGRGLRWILDGESVGEGSVAGWAPRKGRHVLQLVDAEGQVIDQVRFRVLE